MTKKSICDTLRRTCLILAGSLIMAVNLKSFVRTGGLIPGGFNGLTRLIQEISALLWHWEPPFSVINFILNAIPAIISFKFIGKKFTGYSCLMIVVSGILTDIVPSFPMTGGYSADLYLRRIDQCTCHQSVPVCQCHQRRYGFLSPIFLSEKYGIDSWNYIFAGNVVILGIAGALFGWDKALYSIIFQYTSTQVLHILYKRYQKQTLIIVTKRPEDVYEAIAEITHHDATLIKGEGCYSKQECDVLYSVVGRDEVNKVVNTVRKTDPQAFVNMIRTENLAGRFYQRPND